MRYASLVGQFIQRLCFRTTLQAKPFYENEYDFYENEPVGGTYFDMLKVSHETRFDAEAKDNNFNF